jgi:ubiquinone/menaquinone biosynthesis C-methylase UbiE
MGPPGRPINPAAAEGFERAAGEYERARPSYPDEAVRFVVETLPIGPGSHVLDLAAGTGKLTRLLGGLGAAITAVEPVAAMREQLAGRLPEITVLDGTAESIPLADSSVDAVTVAQAFHWFDHAAALAEIARVLRPGGGLALIWNVRDESVDWVRRFTEITIRHAGGTPYRRDYTFNRWSEVFATDRRFTPLAVRRFRFDQEVDIDTAVERAASISFVSALPAAERHATLDEVRRMLERHPELQGRATFSFPYETDVHWCHRTP